MTNLSIGRNADTSKVTERHPTGKGRWFAEARARRTLVRSGAQLDDNTDGSRTEVRRDSKIIGAYRPTHEGLEFSLYETDSTLYDVAYKFGVRVNLRYK